MYMDSCDWRTTASLMCRELGIHPSAWQEAADAMTETVAFVALVVLDRNRFHPKNPTREPGGTLRAMARLALRGELDLTRAIHGIVHRPRSGEQPGDRPKAHPTGTCRGR